MSISSIVGTSIKSLPPTSLFSMLQTFGMKAQKIPPFFCGLFGMPEMQ
jgi:hypothetical protein